MSRTSLFFAVFIVFVLELGPHSVLVQSFFEDPPPCPKEPCHDPMAEKDVSPTMKERITKDTVTGTLMKIEDDYYIIKDNDGKDVKLHIDKSTKMEKVTEGDRVKAYITEKGHTTTLQRGE